MGAFRKPKKHPFYTKAQFEALPLGEKKAAFVAWLMRQGRTANEARLICYHKFKYGDPF